MDSYIEKTLSELKNRISDCEIAFQQVKKNNGVTWDAFCIKNKNTNISPVFYLTDEDRKNLTPEEFVDRTVFAYNREKERGIDFDVSKFSDIDWVRSRIMFNIVNRQRNSKSDLANIPITPDLMITFKVSVGNNAYIRVTNEHLKAWGIISPESLLEDARNNSVVLDKAVFRSLNDVLVDMLLDEYKSGNPNMEVTDELRNSIKEQVSGGMQDAVYMLSTENHSNASMLYPDTLEKIKELLDDNLIILPSSTDEVLIMKEAFALEMGLDVVKSMVQSVNRDVVMQDNATQYLSDEILRYDGELKQIDEQQESLEAMIV